MDGRLPGQTESEVREMPEQKKTTDPMEKLKWETAKELNLDDDLQNPGDELTTREAGKIGGNMVKKLVEKGEEAMAEEAGELGSPPPKRRKPE